MSKSDPSKKACINLIDDPEMIRIKIQKAKTDSLGKIKYDSQRPALQNLLCIYAALEGVPVSKVDQLFTEDNMASFKTKLANKIIDRVCPIGDKAMTMCATHEDQLLDILDQGAREASKAAELTLLEMKQKTGLLRKQ